MTVAALPRMVSEVLRSATPADRVGAFLTVSLTDSPGPFQRARGSARYRVAVAFSWWPDVGSVPMADVNGDPVSMTFEQVAQWLVKTLAGWPVRVALEFNAGRLGAPFDGGRGARLDAYLQALDPVGMRAQAVAARDRWAGAPLESVNRIKSEARAASLDAVAEMLDAMAARAALVGAP